MPNQSAQSGQVVLIVILAIVIVLTIGLAVYVNTLTDVSVTSSQDRSEQALQSAEGAIEDLIAQDDQSLAALAGQTSSIPVGDIDASITLKEEKVLETVVNKLDVLPVKVAGGNAKHIQISWNHPATGSECKDGEKPGIVVNRWQQTGGTTQVLTYVFYSNGCSSDDSKINVANSAPGSSIYNSRVTLGQKAYQDLNGNDDEQFGSEDILLRVRPIFNSISILIEGQAGELPFQLVDITSKATFPQSNETRAVRASRFYSDLPAIFDYALYSGTNLIK